MTDETRLRPPGAKDPSRPDLTEEARLAKESLSQFAYYVSHDLQEPLRTIDGYLDLLIRRHGNELSPPAREFAETAREGAKRMQKMIRGLLDWSRVDTRAGPHVEVSLDETFATAVRSIPAASDSTGARVTHDPLPAVRAEPSQMLILFQCLLSNATKFTKGAPRIHVSSQRDKGTWKITFEDQGIGIDPSQAERIWGIFQRLQDDSVSAGVGMGLPIAKKIVERHGGRIAWEAAPGGGSRFIVWIPA